MGLELDLRVVMETIKVTFILLPTFYYTRLEAPYQVPSNVPLVLVASSSTARAMLAVVL